MTAGTITADEFAATLGVSTWTIYQAVKSGTIPVEPIRVGRRLVWSRAKVALLLGVETLELTVSLGEVARGPIMGDMAVTSGADESERPNT